MNQTEQLNGNQGNQTAHLPRLLDRQHSPVPPPASVSSRPTQGRHRGDRPNGQRIKKRYLTQGRPQSPDMLELIWTTETENGWLSTPAKIEAGQISAGVRRFQYAQARRHLLAEASEHAQAFTEFLRHFQPGRVKGYTRKSGGPMKTA